MLRLIFLMGILSVSLLGCNATVSDNETDRSVNISSDTALTVPPSEVAEDGSCMADTLSFLVGQPETALQAMQYPDNTRILVHGQVVNSIVDPSRLNLVIGIDRNIRFVYCG